MPRILQHAVSDETLAWLRETAAAEKVSLGEIVRRCLDFCKHQDEEGAASISRDEIIDADAIDAPRMMERELKSQPFSNPMPRPLQEIEGDPQDSSVAEPGERTLSESDIEAIVQQRLDEAAKAGKLTPTAPVHSEDAEGYAGHEAAVTPIRRVQRSAKEWGRR